MCLGKEKEGSVAGTVCNGRFAGKQSEREVRKIRQDAACRILDIFIVQSGTLLRVKTDVRTHRHKMTRSQAN